MNETDLRLILDAALHGDKPRATDIVALCRIALAALSFYNDGISNSNSDEFDNALHDAGLL